ncbi:hypothetical protein GCM10011487_00280 [Steroidobacter agaridevorans]|uniref:Uncharacterized protein n=1 Tax=Steroidobacter agaridevorans TaxID=2695856 RepID=A0A829Y4X6_9GAMM|nr:hypothetical protein [Steroidobacter agaridevorans]GFE78028.1 hypothetical protein GCM10011487_00280 [Steroidobacter agaridevorans]
MSSAPSTSALKADIGGQDEVDPDLKSDVCAADRERVELDGRKAFFRLRQQWSCAVIAWISCFLIFHIALTVAIGLGGLDFLQYQWLIPLITVENFLQIVGMGYVVVRFLYPGKALALARIRRTS